MFEKEGSMNIIVFQQNGSAEKKIAGIGQYGKNIIIKNVFSIDGIFPEVVDHPEKYINTDFTGDLVLNYLKHPDLSVYLVEICQKKAIPVITTGKPGGGHTPFTCCGLGKSEKLGEYGKQFGFPEYRVTVEENRIIDIEVLRGAPCGATWTAIIDVIGCSVDRALHLLPLRVQQHCSANPAAFDPISGKSPVHYAGYVHIAALKKAIGEAANLEKTA
jgi:thymidylate synthase